ncbi:MAG: nickel-dependent lactate racemase [Candidatus Hermodarchaeota archaeon]
MKIVKFDYGKNGIEIKIDPSWNVTIIEPTKQKALINPIKSLRTAIQDPIGGHSLEDIVREKEKLESICIVVSDATRPVPSHLIIEALISELEHLGIESRMITILIATGLHRPSNKEEIQRIVGKQYYNKVKVINHNAKDDSTLQHIGKFDDSTPVSINTTFLISDLKIITGYVEPHFFFGFSGGAKAILPGIAGKETIMYNHSAENIASPYSRFGIYEKNPMAEISSGIIKKMDIDFTVNVCINEKHQITKALAGNLEKVHDELVQYQLKHVFRPLKQPFDIVVCGNGGYPLDINLYQAVKSMAIGEMAVKPGGTIISVNECSDGIGVNQDDFRDLLFSGLTPKDIYTRVLKKEIVVPDQWEIQVLARIMQKAEIYVISRLKEHELGNIGLKYADSVENAVYKALETHGNVARILFLPHGPLVLPKII